MMNELKYNLLNGWNFLRVFRLILAVMVLAEAWTTGGWAFGLIGVILLYQSVMNKGCCGSAGCDLPTGEKTSAQHRSQRTEPGAGASPQRENT